MKLSVPIHSFVDLITNSSSEVYVTSDRKTVDAIKTLVNSVLAAGGSTKTCDELLDISLTVEQGWGEYKVIHAVAKDPTSEAAAHAIKTLNTAFQAEDVGNGG